MQLTQGNCRAEAPAPGSPAPVTSPHLPQRGEPRPETLPPGAGRRGACASDAGQVAVFRGSEAVRAVHGHHRIIQRPGSSASASPTLGSGGLLHRRACRTSALQLGWAGSQSRPRGRASLCSGASCMCESLRAGPPAVELFPWSVPSLLVWGCSLSLS